VNIYFSISVFPVQKGLAVGAGISSWYVMRKKAAAHLRSYRLLSEYKMRGRSGRLPGSDKIFLVIYGD